MINMSDTTIKLKTSTKERLNIINIAGLSMNDMINFILYIDIRPKELETVIDDKQELIKKIKASTFMKANPHLILKVEQNPESFRQFI